MRILVGSSKFLQQLSIFLLTVSSLIGLDLEVADIQRARLVLEKNGNEALFRHAQQLLETDVINQSRDLKHIFNKHVLSFAASCKAKIDYHADRWSIQIQTQEQTPGRVQAWWQEQLEAMNCLIPGLGIEHSGVRFHKHNNKVHILSRNTVGLPVYKHFEETDDALLHFQFSGHNPMAIYSNDQGISLKGVEPVRPGVVTKPLGQEIYQAIPQEVFAWTAFTLDSHNRYKFLLLVEQAEDILRASANKEMHSILKNLANEYSGQIFVGLASSNHSFELIIMCEKRDLSTKLQQTVKAPNEKSSRVVYSRINGNRVAFAHNLRLVEILTGERENEFPLKLPAVLNNKKSLEAAGFVNTLILAQHYYDALPMLRHYSERIGTRELNILRGSLRDMVPHFKSMVYTQERENDQQLTQVHGIGNALVLATGLSLCYRYAAGEQRHDEQYLQRAYERLLQQRQDNDGKWPLRLQNQNTERVIDYCYIMPAEADDYDLPILIENPARNGGVGSFVVLSNGKTHFIKGRQMWNRGLAIQATNRGSQWMDWRSVHHELRRHQEASRHVSLQAQQMRQIFLQIER